MLIMWASKKIELENRRVDSLPVGGLLKRESLDRKIFGPTASLPDFF